MKKFFTDLSFLFLFIFFIYSFINDAASQVNVDLSEQIEDFEENISNDEMIDVHYGVNSVVSDNVLGLVIKSISNICLGIIEGFVFIVFNFIGLLV